MKLLLIVLVLAVLVCAFASLMGKMLAAASSALLDGCERDGWR